MPDTPSTPERVVWARKHASTTACPKSCCTPQSLAWLEEFVAQRRLGLKWPEEIRARDAEAFLILQGEWEAEAKDG